MTFDPAAQQLPPEAMMQGAPMPVDPAMMGAPAAPPDADTMIAMLTQALTEGWNAEEAGIDGERQQLVQMLMMMLEGQAGPAQDPMAGYAEGALGPVAGPDAL